MQDKGTGNPEIDAETVGRMSAQLFEELARRVRILRQQKGFSRRVLSDISGVSPRTLAQLEAGSGNISLGLLLRVALALDTTVAELTAPTAAKAGGKAQRICLIGLRGAGKSTLGAATGAALDIPFIELNRQIEADAGMPIGEVMALYGEAGYRRLEGDALKKIADERERVILAVGGGIVSEPETLSLLRVRFRTIWIKASPEEHMARVRAQGDERPMAGNPAAMAQLRAILSERAPLYGQADAELSTSGKTVAASVRELSKLVERMAL